ncbi:MAG: hypothetical protein Fur007_02980 [Rhodoferax sp.]
MDTRGMMDPLREEGGNSGPGQAAANHFSEPACGLDAACAAGRAWGMVCAAGVAEGGGKYKGPLCPHAAKSPSPPRAAATRQRRTPRTPKIFSHFIGSPRND